MLRYRSDDTILELVHFLAYELSERKRPTTGDWRLPLVPLERMLEESGSKWKVAIRDDRAGLETRVPEGVALAATAAMQTRGAGPLLAAAWGHAFGRSPDRSAAYRDAIRAVEEAAIPVVQPRHGKATLGTVIGQMKGDADWALPIEHENKLLVLTMCEQLWGGQTDRHGANNSHAPSQAAAEAAVLLAVPLVQWFTSGAVQRRPPTA